MKLTISHPTHTDKEYQLIDSEINNVKDRLQEYMESNKTKNCHFKLEGEAELRKQVVMSALFG